MFEYLFNSIQLYKCDVDQIIDVKIPLTEMANTMIKFNSGMFFWI